jgi:Zn-dependent membrane protease YugP
MRRFLPWLLMLALTAGLTATTTVQTLRRYEELNSGWSWDLAYYNQWFWALTHGTGQITARPIGPWTTEGPSVWTMNYLAPIRLAIAPVYHVFPDPRTLLVIQAVVLWLAIPAAYGLVKAESGSAAVALSAAVLVPLTPLLWPIGWNDFRELQLGPPFVLWAIHGVRSRDIRLAALGIGGLLACREEYAVLVASLALLPPREPDDVGRRRRWALGLGLTGLGWLLFGFLGYTRWCVNSYTFEIGYELFRSPLMLRERLLTAAGFLSLGFGSWTALACLKPRAGVLVVPWLWKLSGGLFAIGMLGTGSWHQVRYTTPMVALVLAAGCLGYAQLARRLRTGRAGGGPARLGAVWLVAALGLLTASARLQEVCARAPRPISPAEARQVWTWIRRVAADEGVIAHYDVCAPLSSRRKIFSYVMAQNPPLGYPQLEADIAWIFQRKPDPWSETFLAQGFQVVHEGSDLRIYRRSDPGRAFIRDRGDPIRMARAMAVPPVLAWDSDTAFVVVVGTVVLGLEKAFRMAVALAPILALALWARRRIAAATAGAAAVGVTGRQAAEAILASAGQDGVEVRTTDGPPSDYYDRVMRTVRLSSGVAGGRTVGALAVAAREAAHAVLHARGDRRSRLRDALVIGLELGQAAGWLMMAAGVALWSTYPVYGGIILLTASTVLALPLLLWLDRDASRLAPTLLDRAGLLRDEDRPTLSTALAALAWTPAAAACPAALFRALYRWAGPALARAGRLPGR